jgi:hypothetical protein
LGCQGPPQAVSFLALLDLLGLSDLFGLAAGVSLLGGRLVTLLRSLETHLEHTHCGGGENSTHRLFPLVI